MAKNDISPLKVFHWVDGMRVPKPGNKCDPNRRYSNTVDVSTGERYLLEFTDEEEKEADERAAKWEAELPKREAERRAAEAKAKEFRDSLVYEPRLVAFIDILGWSQAIKNSISDPEMVKDMGVSVDALRGQVVMVEWMKEHSGSDGWPGDPQISQFSDCIVYSTKPDRHGLSQLTSTLKFLSMLMLQRGFLVRGGIACGLMYHSGALAYGPALVEAYDLEQRAIYPRIILSQPLAESLGRGDQVQDRDGNLLGRIKTWRLAPDGYRFLDFLQPIIQMPGIDISDSSVRNSLDPARKLIESGLQEFRGNPRVFEKYRWAAEYFNSVAAEYPSANIGQILWDLDDEG